MDATLTTRPFAELSPDRVLAAVEAAGVACDGHLQALNSFENRVYLVGIEEQPSLVAKFYRPGRWSDAQILEEHAFSAELAEAELPVAAACQFGAATLLEYQGFRYALFPRRPGREPQLESADTLRWLGRLLARIHAIGAQRAFLHRPTLDVETFGRSAVAAVLDSNLLPTALHAPYRNAALGLLEALDNAFAAVGPLGSLRLHGDCHRGNVLWADSGPQFVDLDDARNGPAVQDLWMLAASRYDLELLLEGYSMFRDFDRRELALIEPLRALRQLQYAGWLAARWDDPAFPANFPWAGEARWWEGHIGDLRDAAGNFA